MDNEDNVSVSSQNIDDLKRQLKGNKRYFKGEITKLDKLIKQDSEAEPINIQKRINRLNDTFNKYSSLVQLLAEEEEEDLLDDEELELYYEGVVAKATQFLKSVSPNNQGNSSLSTLKSQISLPPITLPSFSGKYNEWTSFFDTFTSLVHSNKEISDIQKFHYLKSALKGDAAQLIMSLEISAANYNTAWTALKERYDNKRLIMQNHLKAILTIPSITKESFAPLRNLLDLSTQHLQSLFALGRPPQNLFDDVIVHILASKLDNNTRRQWESLIGFNEFPNWDKLKEFLVNKCNVLEMENISIDKQEKLCDKRSIKHTVSLPIASSSSKKLKCNHCYKEHLIINCDKFKTLSLQRRIDEVRNKKLCTNCLRPGHLTSNCNSRGCLKCSERHHTLLHLEDLLSPATEVKDANLPSQSSAMSHCMHPHSSVHVLLSTCKINILDANGKYHEVRALLDSGSQVNFISTALAERLKLHQNDTIMPIKGVSQSTTYVDKFLSANLKSRVNDYQVKLKFLVMPTITGKIPASNIKTQNINIPRNIELADPTFYISDEIDLLIGAELFYSLMCVGRITVDNFIYQKTLFGWIVAGSAPSASHIAMCNKVSIPNDTDILNDTLRKFWEIENIESKTNLTPDELQCEKHFKETVTRLTDGRFCVSLPWKQSSEKLSSSREQATRRFYSIERKLAKNSSLQDEYVSFMEEYLSLGHMKLAIDQASETGYFLPHHSVLKESSLTTKLRVVFDASAKTSSGYSLNDCLMVGPTIQDDLFSILIRFRTHKIALTADIEKMYRQVCLSENEKEYHRILWRSNAKDQLKIYELQTVTYGTASAAFLATRCLHELAIQEREFNPRASDILLRDFYVDDLLTGVDTEDDAISLQKELDALLNKGGMQLRKWSSNSPVVLQSITNSSTQQSAVLTWDKTDTLKTLGVEWNPKNDNIQYNVCTKPIQKVSKRTILSQIAQVFDPLGLLGPIIVVAKLLMQKLWQLKLDWDESVPQDIHSIFSSLLDELNSVNFSIPRYVLKDTHQRYELYGFSDASEAAYGACLYIKTICSDGTSSTILLCAKSRVAPLKSMSLPRLELCAALMLAQLQSKVISRINIKFDRSYCFTDSTIVLAWIRTTNKRWKTFVANRITEILELTNPDSWQHIKSSDNPADIISRGCLPSDLKGSSLWWNGPSWLREPFSANQAKAYETSEEAKNTDVRTLIAQPNFSIFERFSTLEKLVRVTATCFRFCNNARRGNPKIQGPLSVEELRKAELKLKFLAQSQAFSTEQRHLQTTGFVHSSSKIRDLNPFLDTETKLIRVGGRLRNAPLPHSTKFPIVMPSNHPLTKLIVESAHRRNLHSGTLSTLATIRQSVWILNGRSTVRNILRKCVICFKAKPSPIEPLMGNLPKLRVTESVRPFINSGIDYCGPYLIKDGSRRSKKSMKVYIAIFVCFATKAVHIEMVCDLTTEAFLAALQRFIARRGMVANLHSDNGTNFAGANNELKRLYTLLAEQERKVQANLATRGIQWHFIPPRAPHFGGLWEASVKSMKYHFKRVAANALLTFDEMQTLLCQIEAIMNSRPLCPLSCDPNDEVALTPGHFIIGDALTAIPEPDLTDLPTNRLSRWQLIQNLKQHFWKRWNKEYLHELQKRSKWTKSATHQLQVGQLVIVREDNTSPGQWPLGRVIEVHPGDDNVVRAATVRVGSNSIKRSVNKLCVLPMDN